MTEIEETQPCVIERDGDFLPSKLAAELRDAGVDCSGVTCTENNDGDVIAVQIICASEADTDTVDRVCSDHNATPEARKASPFVTVAEQLVAALKTLPPNQPVTAAELLTVLKGDS
jgi:hypothetical protein